MVGLVVAVGLCAADWTIATLRADPRIIWQPRDSWFEPSYDCPNCSPGGGCDAHFCTNPSGVIYYTLGAVALIDTAMCSIPTTILPVGK